MYIYIYIYIHQRSQRISKDKLRGISKYLLQKEYPRINSEDAPGPGSRPNARPRRPGMCNNISKDIQREESKNTPRLIQKNIQRLIQTEYPKIIPKEYPKIN